LPRIPPPTVDELRVMREVAEGKIVEAVREFEAASGCKVRGVEVVRHYTLPGVSYPEVMIDYSRAGIANASTHDDGRTE
jgi:hypothetical protein